MKNDKKILIIEQDGLAALDLKHELEKEDFKVSKVRSLEETEEIITNNKTDLIIANTDIKNHTLYTKIKSLLKKFKLPLIWISSLTKNEMKNDTEGINVIGTFSKPFQSRDIITLIINYFKKKLKSSFQKEKL